jgi:hypothetical protein
MKMSLGRIVLYHPNGSNGFVYAAVVSGVKSATCADLHVFDRITGGVNCVLGVEQGVYGWEWPLRVEER